ncbi:TPA: hypothetical protein ACWQ2B_005129 [Escherichia coli]|nr:hypothetical protein [Escherichia coli]MED9059728.1 hypothetical protein [Escherichia coli]MED9074156.1 hypothetical protein [Escherichia coli]MED9096919.1 hypothetical protein [Escherichia coli]
MSGNIKQMTSMYKTLILIFFLVYTETAMADYTYAAVNENHTITKTFSSTDAPDTWLDLGQLNIGTASGLSTGLSPCIPSTFMCTAGSIDLGFNGQAGYILYLSRKPATIKDNEGNSYMITLAFPRSVPVVGVHEYNSMGGRTWETIANIDNSLSEPKDGNDAASASATAQGYCGNVNGCSYRIGSYIHNNSGMPSVYIKLPKNISAKTISFQDLPVLELTLYISNKAHNTVSPTSAKLYLSGTISVPQRCYIRADKSSFDLGTVYSNADNGILKNMSASITTDCYYAPDNTQQYLKMEPVSGGIINSDTTIYQVDSDSALGIVFNINNNPQCGSSSDNKTFNKEHLMRTITYKQHQTTTDTINFALCKYGVPLITGQKKVILKLTSRWVVN